MEKDTKDQVYQEALDAYKDALTKDPSLPFARFCRQNLVSQRGMEHWLIRHNLRISEERHSL